MTGDAKNSWELYYKSKLDSLLFDLISNTKQLNQNPLFRLILAFVKITPNNKPKLILETGIGIGTYSIGLARRGYKIVGIDFSYDALRILKKYLIKKKITNINLIRADIRAMPLRSVFTHVLSLGVIEHFKNPILVLKQTILPLSSDSLLFLDTPNKNGLFNRIYSIRRRYEQKKGIWPLGLERSFSTQELLKFVESIKMRPLIKFNLNFKLALASATHFSSVSRSEFFIQKIFAVFFSILNPILGKIPSFITDSFGFFSVIIASKEKNT